MTEQINFVWPVCTHAPHVKPPLITAYHAQLQLIVNCQPTAARVNFVSLTKTSTKCANHAITHV